MPYQRVWVAPAVMLVHNGTTVYRVYEYDEVERGPLSYLFTTNPKSTYDGEDDDPCMFDVRDLDVPSAQAMRQAPSLDKEVVAQALREAVEAGLLTMPKA